MDEELIAEERECRPWEELIKNQLQEQEAKSSPGSENVSMPFPHTLPRTSFPTSSLYNAVPQETVIGMPTFSTPAFTGQGETWNNAELSQQSGIIRSFSNFETNQPQRQDLFGQNWSSSELPASDTYFPYEQTASERFPAVPSTSDRLYVYPNVSVAHETISDTNKYHSYQINASNSELEDNCQGYFEHPDFRKSPQCQTTTDSVEECFQNMTSSFNHVYTEERTGIWRNSVGLVDPLSSNVSCYNQNPASQKNIDIPGTYSISDIWRGTENPKHHLKDELICCQKVKLGSKEPVHFNSDYCSKRYLHFSRLESHIRGNTGEKPFKCKVCYKGFALSSNLTRHERVHTGEKSYVCQVCNRGFTQSSSLRRHERIHTGIKPFLCKVCNKGFARTSHLTQHEWVHTGDKPFLCKVCNRGFAHISTLRRHERTHTG